ncbi:TSUP family transporter [Hymenobacter sp. 5317J-9]|uniref:sulfite exporter TauE/SafE family protein n=1 Tax=Hymenobacter sp. 5317J-9 TaxID=2932250 RepID=UPI001FD6E50A|nr:TSUP family transporter [Hymenobacter sp. 5317J-9]UOQ96883.1 TSUP family transporter [Hymenobacter sp. 5317J-9]
MTASLLLLYFFAFLAGFIDAQVGGGGLIQLPAMLLLLPGVPYSTVLGTGKVASLAGTAAALRRYLGGPDAVPLRWRTVAITALVAGGFALLGARAASSLHKEAVRPLVLALLSAMAVYTFWRKDFGSIHAPRLQGKREIITGIVLGSAIGFYDGFFGPGTGSLLLFVFVGLFGYDFLAASASAKFVNVATNIAGLIFFISTGQVLYKVAVPMAICNMLGSTLGARMALRRGSSFVRALFLVVVGAFILRLSWDTFA